MGAPLPEMEPVENASAEALLSSLKTIDPAERRKHASVFNYWLSIRAGRDFPPIRDLDPLEISDAGPWSILLEMVGGGEDAVIRHFGQAIRGDLQVDKIGEAPNPSLLSCIHAKLPLVAACREAFAFEETYDTGDGPRRCWLTLLPFSENGTWIDYVYGYVSLEGADETVEEPPEATAEAVAGEPEAAEVAAEEPEAAEVVEEPEPAEAEPEPEPEPEPVEEAPEPFKVELKPFDEELEALESESVVIPIVPEAAVEAPETVTEPEPVEALGEPERESQPEPESEPPSDLETESESGSTRPSFTAKFMESLASVGGFYGKVAQSGPDLPAGAFVEETEPQPAPEVPVAIHSEPASKVEGTLQSKLSDVRALAEEAREAQVRSNMALYEGLSAAYDFALDAEEAPEEYLRLVEGQGLKIQLRSPMKPVVKLAFDGMCDEPTIKQLEAVLAWALKNDLPRGTLRERIEAEGGIGSILNGKAA